MAEPVAGWNSPVALGLIEPQLLGGVPFAPAIVVILGTILGTLLLWYPMPLVGGALFVGMRRASALDPDWWGVLWESIDYGGSYYEA